MTEQQERLANEIKNTLNKFSENVNKILEEMFSFESKTEKDWEMKCPYKYNDEYFIIFDDGDTDFCYWSDELEDIHRFQIGNVFPTKEAAELEAKRRNLLTGFNAFRDECNGNWEPNWTDEGEFKYCLRVREGELLTNHYWLDNMFVPFGYFKNEKDAERAIELFGDDIKKLFIDCECD